MSDEFIAVATKEVNEDLESIDNLLKSCTNDVDVLKNSTQFQKHTHKIKGLAPMMGKESLGDLSSLLDDVLKKLIDGKHVDGIFNVMLESILQMKQSMDEPTFDFSQINNKIEQL